jgi:hypothetical protein
LTKKMLDRILAILTLLLVLVGCAAYAGNPQLDLPPQHVHHLSRPTLASDYAQRPWMPTPTQKALTVLTHALSHHECVDELGGLSLHYLWSLLRQ